MKCEIIWMFPVLVVGCEVKFVKGSSDNYESVLSTACRPLGVACTDLNVGTHVHFFVTTA